MSGLAFEPRLESVVVPAWIVRSPAGVDVGVIEWYEEADEYAFTPDAGVSLTADDLRAIANRVERCRGQLRLPIIG